MEQSDTFINIIDANMCTVCFRNISNDEICTTNCEHKYCETCLLRWLRRGNLICPMCRQIVLNYNKNNEINHIIKSTDILRDNPDDNDNDENENGNNTIYITIEKWKVTSMKCLILINLIYVLYSQLTKYDYIKTDVLHIYNCSD